MQIKSLIFLVLILSFDFSSAKSVEDIKKIENKLSFSSIGEWINSNIFKPVSDAANVAVDALANNSILNDYIYKPVVSATNSITSAFTSEYLVNLWNDYINNPLSDAGNWISEQLASGVYWIVGSSANTTTEIDPCEYTCFKRFLNCFNKELKKNWLFIFYLNILKGSVEWQCNRLSIR